jgi:putative DNA primase/helicase
MGDVKEYALAYAQRGWKVIPLYGIGEDGNCTCRLGSECGSPGKHPFWRDWPNKASDDPEQIAHWFEQGEYNIGIVCGASNLVVIDIDDEGGEALVLPLLESGVIDSCPQVRTRRGIHLYLSGNVPAAKLRGIDIKSGNGFVVAPPSRRVDGGVYEWVA